MALPAHQQHSRRLLTSWREDNIKIKRHSSAPPPKIRTATASAPVSSTATAASSSAETYDQLSFPMPTFSKALKVIENESYTLRSQSTGRRWRAVSSSRECQFGEVLRAVEVTDEEAAASSPAYFAIKVILFFSVASNCRARAGDVIPTLVFDSVFRSLFFSRGAECGCHEWRTSSASRKETNEVISNVKIKTRTSNPFERRLCYHCTISPLRLYCPRARMRAYNLAGAQLGQAARGAGPDIRGSAAGSGRFAIPLEPPERPSLHRGQKSYTTGRHTKGQRHGKEIEVFYDWLLCLQSFHLPLLACAMHHAAEGTQQSFYA